MLKMTQDMINKIMIEENIFPRWEHNIPTLGTKYSHAGNKTGLRLVVTLLLMMTVGVGEMWGQTTYTYYALHANGKGYMKQRHAAVANDGNFRYENVYDGNGYSIWVYSSDGYLTNDMYYLCEANGTLILSDKPSTKWELVADDGKTRLRKQGTTKIVGLNSGGTPALDEPGSLANKYAVCEMTVVENDNKWEGPKDVSYTVRSPQLVTFMRVYYIHKITATILKDDANKTNQKVVDKKDSRIFQRLTFKSTTDTNRGGSWDIDETSAVIYNKQATGDVSVKATYTLTSCDPIAASNHPAVDTDVTLTIQPAALTPDSAKSYLLFYTKDANYRFPYDTNTMNENDVVNPQGKKDVLTDPDISPNGQISWKVEADAAGFVSFKNMETGRYLYYDATDYTHGSNYGVVKVGETTLPASDNRYKFRLYQPKNHDTYGVCQTIIPYDLQFVVGRSDGDNGIINDGICCAWNVYTTPKVISLWKGNGDSKWKIYAYEAENRLTSDWTINGPNSASGTGTYNFTTTAYYSRNIVGSPTKNTNNTNNRDLEIAKTYTKLPVKYNWTVSGLNSYITTTNNSSNGEGKLAVSVNSMPVSNTLGTVKCEAFVDKGSYTLTVDKVEREFTVEKKLSNDKSVAFNLYSLSTEPSNFTEISSLSQITDASGYYKLTADCDNVPAEITEFTGWLDGNNHTVSGLSAPLFAKMSGSSVVRNLNLKDVSISASGKVGAICAEAAGNARIYNVGILSGNVGSSDDYCGGLVGLLDGSARVINCFSYANITGGTYVGGIVGYNNYATTSVNMMTMVMNCMFYGDITGGSNVAPIYNGKNIDNLQDKNGLNTYNYYAYTQLTTKTIDTYNCALAVEDKYLNRFEYYRLLLNSNKKLAAFYVTGNAEKADLMAKWVLETADRTIDSPKPYPVLKQQGVFYPSIINPDITNAPDSATVGRNYGGKLGKTISVTIATSKTDGGQTWPTGASITNTSLTLQRTDKDEDRFNFNYDKVQLPYYDEVGEGNYTGNRVVTGWKITYITPVDGDPYTASNYDYTKKYGDNPEYYEFPNYNFADRHSSNKDLYTVSKRVFAQGAYFDVPYGVTDITIEPYWAKCAYLSNPNYDVVYTSGYGDKTDVTATGTQVTVGTTFFDGQSFTTNNSDQRIEKAIANALGYISGSLGGFGPTVYDNAVVLVGNFHQAGVPSNGTNPFTIMSVDLDKDHEPDYSMIYHHSGRVKVCPIRYDFLNIPGTAQAQKPNGASNILNGTIYKTNDWFEITNTSSMYFSQFEYENIDNQDSYDNTDRKYAPLILQGGIFDQFVSTKKSNVDGKVIYIHVGGNAWFHEFGMGTHSDGSQSTPHVPVSVTGGDYDGFYLTGTYNANAGVRTDNAECYISGGRFGELAGAAQEQINGNVTWQIYNADITSFFGGGTNDAKPIKGTITTDIIGSHVTTFCGGPKFGNMSTDKAVTTTATDCTFGTFFGAGYGGNSYSRRKYYDEKTPDWMGTLQGYYTSDKGKYYNGSSTNLPTASYGKKGPGVGTDIDYEFFVWSGGQTGGRFFVKFVSFSLAQCDDVSSTLTNCTVTGNFYGGGSLGKVAGDVTSTLTNCTVEGNVFGAGYSASLPTIKVRDSGFSKAPNYNKNSGMFEPAEFSGTTEYTWTHVDSYPSEGGDGFDGTQVITTQSIDHSDLGSVAGNVILTIKGSSVIGTEGDTTKGNVFGGGESSYVTGASNKVTVNIEGNTLVYGNVFGGGDKGEVQGSSEVNIMYPPKTTTTTPEPEPGGGE